MVSEWIIRPMKRDGQVVWVIYRLKDGDAPDRAENRDYWPRNDCPGWSTNKEGAVHMAQVLNELDRLRQRK